MSLGFRTDHLLMVSATLRPQSYDSVRGDAAYRELLRRAAAVPGVKSAALTRFVPFGYDRESAVVFPIASGVPVPANGFGYCVDVIAGDATSGLIDAYDLVMLEDDRRYFPPYDAAAVARTGTLRAHPEVEQALRFLGGRIAMRDMRRMNHAVDAERREPADVARQFLARLQ